MTLAHWVADYKMQPMHANVCDIFFFAKILAKYVINFIYILNGKMVIVT